MTSAPDTLHLHRNDNVIIALRDLEAGSKTQAADGERVELLGAVARGHKAASRPIRAGEPVRRYGQVIGVAKADIPAGAHVHVHNLGMSGYGGEVEASAPAVLPPKTDRTFMGYHRADGRVGTRNYIGLVTTVN